MNRSQDIRMVDVNKKPVTVRQATAKGKVVMKPSTLNAIKKGDLPKGDVLSAAKVAGIMAAKQTHNLMPLCHPLIIDNINVELKLDEKAPAVEIAATVKGSGKTGFEMEALTAVTISALTVYDMCKSIDTSLHLENIRLTKKSGGKSGEVVLE
jgi:cyclic pyranopterin phosphate synthase